MLVALALLLTPSQGLVYEPLKDLADELRQAIYDRFFFTEPRNIFSLASQGYYPKGPNQLGGAAEPSDEPVMQVAAPEKVYLRGTLFNEYTGRVWLNTTGGHRYLYDDFQWRSLRSQLFDMNLPQGALAQTGGLFDQATVRVKMVNTSASTLFVPQRVRKLQMVTGDMVPYFNNASELFITRDLAIDDEYIITAPLLMAGDGGLQTVIEASALTQDDHYAQIAAEYTQLPSHMEQQVFELVNKVVEGKATHYEKALAIQNYLSRYYRYTLTPEEEPDNVDFVSYFLLRGKEGYCTYFASAMTVMCRMAGIPARYV
ncbi:MAG: transglutaminase domain-containing protein, partial [Clostridia bacterium]|nr:transglutaminase domain-containing protein [Clostridia bacterium]